MVKHKRLYVAILASEYWLAEVLYAPDRKVIELEAEWTNDDSVRENILDKFYKYKVFKSLMDQGE
jgi:hypothetical protein